jgi:hypothetical protein
MLEHGFKKQKVPRRIRNSSKAKSKGFILSFNDLVRFFSA